MTGWLVTTLGKVCDFQGGSQPPKSQFLSEIQDGYIRLLQIRDFKSDSKAIYIPETTKNRTCQSDDIMLARYGASVGQIHRGKAGAYNVALIRTIPDTKILDKDFFYYYLLSELFQKPLLSVAERSAQAGFSKADIEPFEIPTPPIPEQQHIVAILDQAFADIEQARANAEQNLKNARELFESYLQQVFTEGGDGWVDTTLESICKTTQGVQIPKSEQSNDNKIGLRRYLYISDFKTDKNTKYVEDRYDNKLVSGDDLIVVNTGNSAGDIFYGIDGILSNNLFKVSFDNEIIDKDYLYHFVNSSLFKKHQKGIRKGTANPHMGHENFKSTPVKYPAFITQKQLSKNILFFKNEVTQLQRLLSV